MSQPASLGNSDQDFVTEADVHDICLDALHFASNLLGGSWKGNIQRFIELVEICYFTHCQGTGTIS